jgi:hypothetical protein
MGMMSRLIVIICGVLNFSYLFHLLEVCLPEYLNHDGLAYNGGVSVIMSCIISQFIAFGAIIVILSITIYEFWRCHQKEVIEDGINEI